MVRVSKIVEKPNFIVEDLKNPPKDKIKGYRRIRPPNQKGHLVNIALLKGGGSVATSVWHPKSEKKSSNPEVQAALTRKGVKTGGKRKRRKGPGRG